MRQATLFLAALCVAFAAGAATHRYWRLVLPTPAADAAGWEATPLYRHRVDLFERVGPDVDLAMVGDSITALGEWSDLLPELRIANRGIMGDTTAGALKRLPAITATSPEVVGIMLGINDFRLLRSSPDAVADRYVEIVRRLAPARTIMVFSTLYVAEPEALALNNSVALLNDRLKAMCRSAGCTFIDLNRVVAPAGHLSADFSLDGLHLNGAGYLAWRDAITASGLRP